MRSSLITRQLICQLQDVYCQEKTNYPISYMFLWDLLYMVDDGTSNALEGALHGGDVVDEQAVGTERLNNSGRGD